MIRSCMSKTCGLPLTSEETSQHLRINPNVPNIPTGVDSHWKDELVELPIIIVEMIHPYLFNISRINPAMAVCAVLDKHHGR